MCPVRNVTYVSGRSQKLIGDLAGRDDDLCRHLVGKSIAAALAAAGSYTQLQRSQFGELRSHFSGDAKAA
jgi:hypothetical protein